MPFTTSTQKMDAPSESVETIEQGNGERQHTRGLSENKPEGRKSRDALIEVARSSSMVEGAVFLHLGIAVFLLIQQGGIARAA